jgi:hypothetical protein
MKKATVTPGVIVESVGDDLMVVVPGNSDVVSLTGRPAEVLLDVQAGRDVDPSDPALETLSDFGIVTSPGMSRRGLITAGALGAGAGVVMLSMPAAAAAGSGPEDSNGGGTNGGGEEPSEELLEFDGDVFAIYVQGSTTTEQVVMDEFQSAVDDLYILFFIEYTGSNLEEPTTKTTGTITTNRFSGSRKAVFFPSDTNGDPLNQWIAHVGPKENPRLTDGTFELKYQGFLIKGPVTDPEG